MDKTTTQAQQTATAPAAPAERTVQQKFLRIMELAMQLNSTPTKNGYTGNKPTVFVQFSGHIPLFEVEVHSHGWQAGRSCDVSCTCPIDGEAFNLDRSLDFSGRPHTYLNISQMLSYLESLVSEWRNA